MEFSSIRYFSFWSLISITFLTAGIYALHKSTIQFSFLLEYYFVLSVSCSISYAFLDRPALEHDQQELQDAPSFFNFLYHLNSYAFFVSIASGACDTFSRNNWRTGVKECVVATTLFLLVDVVKSVKLGFKYSQIINPGFSGPSWMYPYHILCWILLQGFFLLSLLQVYTTPLFWDLHRNFTAISISIPVHLLHYSDRFRKLVTTSSIDANDYQERRIVEIACGVLANTMAQYYFRYQSLPLMLAFLSLAVSWLGNIAIVRPRTDFGIFQFLITSGLQSAVSLFGLHFYTFLVVLRWKMDSVSLKHFGRRPSVSSESLP